MRETKLWINWFASQNDSVFFEALETPHSGDACWSKLVNCNKTKAKTSIKQTHYKCLIESLWSNNSMECLYNINLQGFAWFMESLSKQTYLLTTTYLHSCLQIHKTEVKKKTQTLVQCFGDLSDSWVVYRDPLTKRTCRVPSHNYEVNKSKLWLTKSKLWFIRS